MCLLGMSLTANLAWWQYQRGQARAAILAMHEQAAKQSPEKNLRTALPGKALEGQKISVTGRFAAEKQLFLDNQTVDRTPGYHVWTPLKTEAGWVIVNRGWLKMSLDRSQLPQIDSPDEEIEVVGLWQHLPVPGLRLGDGRCAAELAFPAVVQYPTVEQLQCRFDAPIAAGQLLLDVESEHGFRREWRALGLPPQRHYGYALQWLALTLTQLVLLIVLNVRRT